MAIQQEDITSGSINITKVGSFSITTTVLYLQGNVSGTAYALGTSSSMSTSAPLQIKESGNASATGWAEEQDFSFYNVSYTSVIPWFDVAPGIVTPTTASATFVGRAAAI